MNKEIEYLEQIKHELQQRHMDMIADDECDNEAISIIIDDYKEKFNYIKKSLIQLETIKKIIFTSMNDKQKIKAINEVRKRATNNG